MNPSTLTNAIDDLVRKHSLACEALTQSQLAEVIRQAILYLPGYGNDDLRFANNWQRERIAALEAFIQANGLDVPPDGREDL